VYLSHNNPGYTVIGKAELGLSFAVYYALTQHTPTEASARAIYQAAVTALEEADRLGLRVVLPLGYQIQMGPEWNARHPEALRRGPDGAVLLHWTSHPSASPYAPVYQADIAQYYRWIEAEILARFPSIFAVNLADEPLGSDFSPWAQAVFRERYGEPFESADPVPRGAFLAEFVADYAALSATLWAEVNPLVPAMMTFHFERDRPWVPNLEAIFQKTPPTFIVSADTHLHDVLPELPLTSHEIDQLYGLVRTLAYLSHVYEKRLMLWTSANSWGLTTAGGLREARRNFQIVHQTAREGGAKLGMLLAWAWNIKWQGAYACESACAFDPEAMIETVSGQLSSVRDGLSAQASPRIGQVLYLPAELLYRQIGQDQVTTFAEPYVDLGAYRLRRERAIYLTDGPALDAALAAGLPITPVL
jgi:hypothetical protein